jgi:predicted nuclease with TOPRIM domain
MNLEQAINVTDQAFANINANRATHRTLEMALQTIQQAHENRKNLLEKLQNYECEIAELNDRIGNLQAENKALQESTNPLNL